VLTQAILSLAFCNWANSLVVAPWLLGWPSGLARETSRSPALLGRQGSRHTNGAINRGMEVLPSSFSNNV